MEWCSTKSNMFTVKNGVRQGAVLSPTLFSIYIDDLFTKIGNSGYGCYINKEFCGLTGYADDLVLLSPSVKGLQCMVSLANKTFNDLGLKISVNHENPEKSKTKCLAFGLKNDPAPIYLDGSPLPWCDSYKHLGHILCKDGSLKMDIDKKRTSFIGMFHALRQELKQQHPLVYMQLIDIYLAHFYGSNLWNLFDIEKLYKSWNNVLRNVYGLPYKTHRYILEPFTDQKHIFTKLTNKFINFYKSLFNSNKSVIRTLLLSQESDCRSNFGINTKMICQYNLTNSIFSCKKDFIKYKNIAESDVWRIGFLNELIDAKNYKLLPNFSDLELNSIIEFVACN